MSTSRDNATYFAPRKGMAHGDMTGFSPGGAVPIGYSYLDRSPSLVTSTRRGPARGQKEARKALGKTDDGAHQPRFPTSWTQSSLTGTTSPPSKAKSRLPDLPRSKTESALPTTLTLANTAQRLQDSLASHSLAALPADPRTWLPAEVSLYLCHVFANVPLPVREILSHFVVSTHLTGKAFLQLRERELEQSGMNTRWRRLFLEASRRLGRDAIRKRLWTAGEGEWSTSDDGTGSSEPGPSDHRQNAIEQKRVMTLTLKRIQNRKYVKGVIEGFEAPHAEANESSKRVPQESPRRMEGAAWTSSSQSMEQQGKGPLVSPTSGSGYVRERVKSLSTPIVVPISNSKVQNLDEIRAHSYEGSALGQVPCDHQDPKPERNTMQNEVEDIDSTDAWSPLEKELVDAILQADLSCSEDNNLFDVGRMDGSLPFVSVRGGDEVNYDPVKPFRGEPSISPNSPTVKVAGPRTATSQHDIGIDKEREGQGEVDSHSERGQNMRGDGQVASSTEHREGEPEEVATANTRRGNVSGPPCHKRTLSKASTRSNKSFLSAFDTFLPLASTTALDEVSAKNASVQRNSFQKATRHRSAQSGSSISTLFQLDRPHSELVCSEGTSSREEFAGEGEGREALRDQSRESDVKVSQMVESVLLKRAELLLSPMLDVGGGDGEVEEGEEQGRFDDPLEEVQVVDEGQEDRDADADDLEVKGLGSGEEQVDTKRDARHAWVLEQEDDDDADVETSLAAFFTSSSSPPPPSSSRRSSTSFKPVFSILRTPDGVQKAMKASQPVPASRPLDDDIEQAPEDKGPNSSRRSVSFVEESQPAIAPPTPDTSTATPSDPTCLDKTPTISVVASSTSATISASGPSLLRSMMKHLCSIRQQIGLASVPVYLIGVGAGIAFVAATGLVGRGGARRG